MLEMRRLSSSVAVLTPEGTAVAESKVGAGAALDLLGLNPVTSPRSKSSGATPSSIVGLAER